MTLAAAVMMVVLRPVASMYSAPSESADVVSQAILGSNVELVEQRAGWIKVRTADQYQGWMPAASLREGKASGPLVKIGSLFANLYQEPDATKHQPLLTVPFESRLEVVAESPRWLQVRLPDGRAAWLQRGDVALDVDQTVVELARRFLGLPYLWGGVSTFGFDCSGFTGMLLRQRGVIIPRDAGPQMRWEGFTPVERSNLQAGDLLFFGESAEKVTHTGMYIGNGEFISATTWLKPVVQISRLDDPHWSGQLVGCRRLK
jgi:cell wall-associated NlpC family hydrolase